jgi:sulfite exporter TauE/SafE
VLLLMQATAWAIAGLSAIPFALAGELAMLALGLATLLFALGAAFVAIGVVWRRRWARRVALALEAVSLFGSLLLLLLPIGANHGPVGLLTNVAMPLAVIVLLRKPCEALS